MSEYDKHVEIKLDGEVIFEFTVDVLLSDAEVVDLLAKKLITLYHMNDLVFIELTEYELEITGVPLYIQMAAWCQANWEINGDTITITSDDFNPTPFEQYLISGPNPKED